MKGDGDMNWMIAYAIGALLCALLLSGCEANLFSDSSSVTTDAEGNIIETSPDGESVTIIGDSNADDEGGLIQGDGAQSSFDKDQSSGSSSR